jgi:hypothetical protein
MFRVFVMIGLLIGSTFARVAAAQNPSKGKPSEPTTIDVTSLVRDQDDSVPANEYLQRSDGYNGLNQTTYTNTGGVTSTVGLSTGAWSLRLYSQTLRRIWLTLKTLDGSTPVAPSGYYSQYVEIYSACFDSGGNRVAFLAIPAGTSNNRCILGLDFGDGRTKYKLTMGQFATPASGWATVTCHASSDPSGVPCTSWTISPNTIDANPTVANMYKFGPRGLVYIGQYYNTFRIDVTYP